MIGWSSARTDADLTSRRSRSASTCCSPTSPALGGEDAGPAPFDLLLASLGACTSITLRMYAERKRMPLTRVSVELQHDRIAAAGGGRSDHIVRRISLEGDLSAEQRDALLAIANKCPMYRTLRSDLQIDSLIVG